jgi:hypothetical protein
MPPQQSASPRIDLSLRSAKLRRSKGVKFGGLYTSQNRLYYQNMSYSGTMLLPFQVRPRASASFEKGPCKRHHGSHFRPTSSLSHVFHSSMSLDTHSVRHSIFVVLLYESIRCRLYAHHGYLFMFKVLMTYWDMNKFEVEDVLTEFLKKSLAQSEYDPTLDSYVYGKNEQFSYVHIVVYTIPMLSLAYILSYS